MKKRYLILSAVGAAAGLLFGLEANRRKRDKHATADGESGTKSELSGNGRAASMATIKDGKAAGPESEADPVIDDRGTDQFEASQILTNIRDRAFDASNEKLALALGRPTEEIEEWTSGVGLIDGDVVMKARALAIQRGLEAE